MSDLVVHGRRYYWGCDVTVEVNGRHRRLPDRTNWICHSETGFEWGYGGSGPAQLALALLALVLPKAQALELYQLYKWEVVAHLPGHEWSLTREEIAAWCRDKVADGVLQ